MAGLRKSTRGTGSQGTLDRAGPGRVPELTDWIEPCRLLLCRETLGVVKAPAATRERFRVLGFTVEA